MKDRRTGQAVKGRRLQTCVPVCSRSGLAAKGRITNLATRAAGYKPALRAQAVFKPALPVYRRCEGRRLQTCATRLPALRRAAGFKRYPSTGAANKPVPSTGAAKGRSYKPALPVYRRCEGPQQTCATHAQGRGYKPALPVYRRCEGPQVTNLRYPSSATAGYKPLSSLPALQVTNLRYPSTGNIQKDDHEGRPYCAPTSLA